MRRFLILIFFVIPFLTLFMDCSFTDGPANPEGNPTNVRVFNEGSIDFSNVLVVFPQDSVDFGAVKGGEKSGYRKVSIAYRYAYIKVTVSSEQYILQPVDYVGETSLASGHFTYALQLTGESLGLRLIKE